MKSLKKRAAGIVHRMLLNPNIRRLTQKLPFLRNLGGGFIAPTRLTKSTVLTQAAGTRLNYFNQRM
jgi:hypothetical protein